MTITIVSYIMMFIIVFLLIREKASLSPVFILVPVTAALFCGYNIAEISEFAIEGCRSILNTALLFLFSVVYFSILQEIGLFEVMVYYVMKGMKNSILLLMIITSIVAMLIQLDGSGAMTMLITIPAFLPLYDAMKVRRTTLVFLVSASAGIMNFMPWCSAMLRLSAATGLESVDIWHALLPIQGIGILIIFLFCVIIAHFEKRKGAGVADHTFKQIKESYRQKPQYKVPVSLLFFDTIFTVFLIILLLLNLIPSVFGFMIGLSCLLILNFPDPKKQEAQIKKHAATAFPLVLTVFSLGCMIGIMNKAGMVNAIADSLISLIPEDLGSKIPLLYGIIGVPLSVVIGSDCCYSILAPVLGNIVQNYGGTAMQSSIVILLASSFAANITFIGPAPYLSVSLAGITMKEHLKYSFKLLWILCIILVIIAAIIHII